MSIPAIALTTTGGSRYAASLRGLPYFERTQDWAFRLVAWDTPQTALQASTATQGLQLRVVEPGTTPWATYVTNLTAPSANLTTAFNAGTVLVDDGRWATAQGYWGGGTPNWWGGTQPGKVAVFFRGSLVSAARRAWLTTGSTFGFAVAGSGKIRIDRVDDTLGTRTTVLDWTDLTEGNYLAEGFVYSTVQDFAGCRVEVFYLQTGSEPWGGLVVKAVPTAAWPSAAADKTALAAAAPVLSGGLFAHGASPVFDTVAGNHVAAAELPFILQATVTNELGSATRLSFDVPLVNPLVHDGHGWAYNRANDQTDPGYLELYDGGTLATFTLRRKRLVQLQVALRDGTTPWTPIFTGHVHDFSGGSDGKLTVECLSFETRMVEQYEQLPDRISYMSRGYRTVDFFDTDAPTEQPVYNIPAFDHWPLEWAVEELGVRAGIDPSCFRAKWTELTAAGTAVQVQLPWNATPSRFRAESLTGQRVQLPRPVHYGNAGVAFTETRPFDDEYVFKVEPTKDLWARSRDLTDKMGYTWRFNAAGEAVLHATNVPTHVHDLTLTDITAGAATEIINASAYGAKYLRSTAGVTVRATVRASRIDASFPRQASLQSWTLSVARASAPGTPIHTATINPSQGITSTLPRLYTLFDSPTTGVGTNATVTTLYSGDYDEYIVTLTAASGMALVDCLLCYPVDPDTTVLPPLSIADTALSVQTRPQQDGTRNKVTIVGRRKGAVTDSEKFAEAQAPTEQEFVVANAVDVDSITNPQASNYVGYLKQSVIYDASITDEGFAQYLAQVYIYRQRTPQPGTSVQHTLLPIVQLSEPVAVVDTKFDTTVAATRQYVRRIEHQLSADRMTTTLETSAWPDFPAYQPRTDIDLAAFNNKPISDLTIQYTSLAGYTITNPAHGEGTPPSGFGTYNWVVTVPRKEEDAVVTLLNVPVGSAPLRHLPIPDTAPWPPLPGTLQIRPNTFSPPTPPGETQTIMSTEPAGTIFGLRTNALMGTLDLQADHFLVRVIVRVTDPDYIDPVSGNPFEYTFDYTVTKDRPSDAFWYQQVDTVITVYRGTGALPSLSERAYWVPGVQVISVEEDRRVQWLANTPYHEYTGVDYRSTAAASDKCLLYLQDAGAFNPPQPTRVTSYDIRYRPLFRKADNADPLSVPNGLTSNGEPFSAFYDPYTSELGHVVTVRMNVLANGLYRVSVRSVHDDTIVAWLTNTTAEPGEPEQHWEYIPVSSERSFTWDGVDQIGQWNAAQSELYQQLVGGSFRPDTPVQVGRGYYVWNREVAGSTVADQAYIWMKRDTMGKPVIGHGTYAAWYIQVEAVSDALQATGRKATISSAADNNTVVLTHLPEPTKLELKIQDYVGTEPSGSWAAVQTTWDNLVATDALSAYINNQKPVRIRFKVQERPGKLWEGRQGDVSVKLTREAHLRAYIADQVVVYAGKEFAGSTVEDRTIYNRRLVNDEHTKHYEDADYRRASSFKWNDGDPQATEWVFRPSDFKSDFMISGVQESIEFGNYLQLEEVPDWAGTRDVSSRRARLNMALMSYLFYLSAYVTDRSGRSTWGINRSFIDKSKIPGGGSVADFPEDATYQLRRTVVCRQWTNEATWKSSQRDAWGYSDATLFDRLLQHFWWQHEITALTIGVDLTPWSSFALTRDFYSFQHANGISSDYVLPGAYGNIPNQARYNRQLGRIAGGTTTMPVVENHLGRTVTGGLTLGTWTWQTAPTWIPSITRDFHPFFLLPPMVSPRRDGDREGFEVRMSNRNMYLDVAGKREKVRTRNGQEINRYDIAAAETWSSGLYDMSELAVDPTFAAASLRIRFWPGNVVDVTRQPYKTEFGVTSSTVNYVRQDETVHWEDLRGTYSRGKYPTAQPIKVAAGNPYYLNQFRYGGIEVGPTLNVSRYPLLRIVEPSTTAVNWGLEWFRIAFRSEYIWESGSMFPTNQIGKEFLEAALWWRTRYLKESQLATVYYDYGAWVGWKDDLLSPGARVIGGTKITSGYSNPFLTGHMPVGVGPVLPTTVELTAHLVLLANRRGS